jgi:hypothetical protein
LSGDVAAIGAPRDDIAQADAGAVYIFERIAGICQFTQLLTVSDAQVGDAFGWSISIYQDQLAIGAPEHDDNGNLSGSAYVFRRSAPPSRDASANDFSVTSGRGVQEMRPAC